MSESQKRQNELLIADFRKMVDENVMSIIDSYKNILKQGALAGQTPHSSELVLKVSAAHLVSILFDFCVLRLIILFLR